MIVAGVLSESLQHDVTSLLCSHETLYREIFLLLKILSSNEISYISAWGTYNGTADDSKEYGKNQYRQQHFVAMSFQSARIPRKRFVSSCNTNRHRATIFVTCMLYCTIRIIISVHHWPFVNGLYPEAGVPSFRARFVTMSSNDR